MKKRMGFVSNSSSSSFIVGVDKVPTTKEELRNIIGKDVELKNEQVYFDNDEVLTELFNEMEVVNTIPDYFEDYASYIMKNNEKHKEIYENFIREVSEVFKKYGVYENNKDFIHSEELKSKTYFDLTVRILEAIGKENSSQKQFIDISDSFEKIYTRLWEEGNKINKKEFMDKYYTFLKFSFSDDTPQGCLFEHGDDNGHVFKNTDFAVLSEH